MSAEAPRVLAVAGSDSSGRAGLQADLRVIALCGCAAASAVTAVTAQDALGGVEWEAVSVGLVRAQLRAGLEGPDAAAVKTGMLATAEIVTAVADELRTRPRLPVVCDPVARSTSGYELLNEAGVRAVRDDLLPRVTLVTPNADEALLLSGRDARNPEEAEAAGRALLELGAAAVLVTGGHFLEQRGTDVLVTRDGVRRFSSPAVDAPNARGTGCMLSTGIACALARGEALPDAVEEGRRIVRESILGAASR